MTKAVLLLLCCLVAGAWAASANPKKLTREQEKAFLAALGMSGIRGKIRARRDASLRDHTSSKGENICYNSFVGLILANTYSFFKELHLILD